MKKVLLFILSASSFYQATAQASTGFDGYTGPGTEPAGWNIANGTSSNTYTSVGNFGLSSPSVRLDLTGESITSPTVTTPTSIQFWGKGQSIAGAGALLVEQFVGGTWTSVINLTFSGGTLLNAITTYGPYTLNNNATQVRLTYTKGAGNMAIDDIILSTGVLPVKLSTFAGSYSNKTSVLNWTTENETNVSGYSIERSNDGIHFSEIGFVPATNNRNYSYTDNAAKSDANYYRLKINGNQIIYSGIIKILTEAFSNELNLYPTPTVNTINAEFNSDSNQMTGIFISDISGKLILQKTIKVLEGYNNINFEVSSLQKGMYVLKLVTSNKIISSVFIKQ